MYILGIESSCDETGVAIYDIESDSLISDTLYSQIDLHKEYGGVVPELASREHVSKLYSLTELAIKQANLSVNDIGCVAYTSTPGLLGALMVGASFAKTFAYVNNIPSIAIHHLEGHLLSPYLDKKAKIEYPYTALLVSGGHTQIYNVKEFGSYELVGESIDDAVGEAFDKTSKLLGMGYPGGVEVSNLADKAQDKKKYSLPRPLIHKPTFDFSFSGLKTAVLNEWSKEQDKAKSNKANLCYEFQEAVVDVITNKISKVMQKYGNKCLVVCGGVSANKRLRSKLDKISQEKNFSVYLPPMKYCTDNGAMIALAGAYRYVNGYVDNDLFIDVAARSSI